VFGSTISTDRNVVFGVHTSMNYQWSANTGSLAIGVCTEEDAARKRIRNSKWCLLTMSIGFTRELTQSLSLLRLHVKIYSTNVDDDLNGEWFMDSYADCLILTDCSAVHVGTNCDHREQSNARKRTS